MSELERQQATIPDDLLRTKLAPPRLHTAFVARPSLLARIDAGLTRKLTLISTPAGFGKTTLVAEWLRRNDERRTTNDEGPAQRSSLSVHRFKVAWVSLDAGDNDPVRFWRYVLSACRAWDRAIGKASLAALRMAQQPSLESVLTPFINDLAQLPGPHVLVLEDYHSITAPEVHAAVTFLIEHLPSSAHLILTTRSEPALPLARLRARNELTELTGEDLRFSRAETQMFLEQTLGISPTPEALTRVEQRAEGWVAGLRLVALALQHKTEPPALEPLLTTFTGGHRHVIEYLVSEVLAVQPEDVRAFLLSTCFLARLTGPLCDALTGRGDGELTLDQLERANLFLTPLGGGNGQRWYRYHALFAEALRQYARQRLGEADVRALHEKAGAWYEAHGLLHDAVEAASAAGQPARAAALIERFFERGDFNELYTLRGWVERLPDDVLREHPLICFAYANALLFTSDRYAPATAILVERWAQLAEAAWREQDNAPRLGQIAALRAMVAFWQGDLAGSFAHARRALALLDEHDTPYRSASLLYLGQEELLAGEIDAAQRSIMEARTLYEIGHNIHGTLAATMLLGELAHQQGDLDQAAQYYQQVLDEAVGGEEMLDDQGYSLFGLSAIAYEHDDLDTAERQAARALELAKQRHAGELQAQVSLVLARVQHARGHTAQAQHMLRSLAAQTREPSLRHEVQSWLARLALAVGDLEAAQRWQGPRWRRWRAGEPMPSRGEEPAARSRS
jgi:LuxR family maltose regulon positive regulatory protein